MSDSSRFTAAAAAPARRIVSCQKNSRPRSAEDLTAEDDRVVLRWTARGTNTGEMMGMPATGKPATVTGMFLNRFAGGKMVEGWGNFDALGMLQQLGVISTPEPARV
jgi:hypothetical protein